MGLEELKSEVLWRMEVAVTSKPSELVVGSDSSLSLAAVIKWAVDAALRLGEQYRHEVEQACKSAVDRLVAMDVPGIPSQVEDTIDEATRAAGYAAITAVLDAVLGPAN